LRTKLAVVGKAALLGAQLRRRYDASTTPKTAPRFIGIIGLRIKLSFIKAVASPERLTTGGVLPPN
jgi:hypothetical protein